jgi:SAM-dependent methyltransferase
VQKLRAFALAQPRTFWPSTIKVDGLLISEKGPITVERAGAIIQSLMTPESVVFQQFLAETKIGDDLQNPDIWRLYFEYYDFNIVHSEGYIDMVLSACSELGREQWKAIPLSFIDLGAGTGNVAAICLHDHPNAHGTLIDISENGLEITKQKLNYFGIAPNRYAVVKDTFLRSARADKGKNHLAIAGNSFYTLPPDEKESGFEIAHQTLVPGGRFVIYEPANSNVDLKSFFNAMYGSIISKGAPVNDFSVLVPAAINRILIRGSKSYVSTSEEIIAMAERKGFVLEKSEVVYYGKGSYHVFRKP